MAVQLTRATDSWTPINLNQLPETPPVPPQLGNTHLVYPGKRHVFSGVPESAKTLAAYCILIQVVRHGGTAILIDFEMGGNDARQRLRELGATAAEIDQIYYLEPDEPTTRQRIQLLIELNPQLVVIDAAAGVYTLEGLDDNKRLDVEKVSALYVREFWRNEIATILIDHVVKDGEHRGRYAIGSERKLGGVDVHLGFETVKAISRGTTGHYKIITHKDRGGYHKRGHIADLKLDSDPETHEIDWAFMEPQTTTTEDGYFRPTHLMEKISIDLQFRDGPATRNQICDALGGKGKGRLEAINALVREGFAAEEDGPNRSKLVRHVRPYREDDPACNPVENPGGAVVRKWFSSGASTTSGSGGAVVRVPYGTATTSPPAHSTAEPPGGANGWFTDNGHLEDSPDLTDLTYLATIEPDEPDQEG